MSDKPRDSRRGETASPIAAHETRRQQIRRCLSERPKTFETLRGEVGASVRDLEDDLHHLARSAKATGARLCVRVPVCRECAFSFERRGERRYARPGRCPRCKSHRVSDSELWWEEGR